MKKQLTIFLIVFVVAVAASFAYSQGLSGLNDATVVVRVVDELGRPVGGVRSTLWSLSDYDAKPGLTDTNGLFSSRLRNIYAEVGGSFEKEGYYQSVGPIWAWKKKSDIPSGFFTIVLKRIINPVPMDFRKVEAYIPRLDEPIGFDLETGDWISPYGKGTISDINFTINKRFVSIDDFDVVGQIELCGELNGIQPFSTRNSDRSQITSKLTPPQTAPENGYGRVAFATNYWHTDNKRFNSVNENRSWMFRTRTKKDEKGKVISANYGWIRGDFNIIPTLDHSGQILFEYYYNPDPHSCSLEPKDVADQQKQALRENTK